MGETTAIAWTDATFNPWWGCQRVSPGCEHCYAESFSKRVGLSVWGPTTDRRFFGEKHWREPLKWDRQARDSGQRRRVFCASMADVFEDRRDLDEWRSKLWSLIASTPGLDWLLLTKRPENLADMVPWNSAGSPRLAAWHNVWLGVTAENQDYANDRIPILLETPAAVHFVSYEPALGPVDFMRWMPSLGSAAAGRDSIDWLICGGESGPGARPFEVAWARDVLDQCRRNGVACFIKQLGRVPTVLGVPVRYHEGCVGDEGWEAGRLNDPKGGDWEEWPQQLRVREFPTARKAA